MIPERVLRLLRSVRRRLRVAWAAETLQLAAPLTAVGALALVLLGRFAEWASWAEPVAVGLAVVSVLVIVGTALAVRIDDRLAARAADNGLHTHDAFASALELGDVDPEFGPRIVARADHLAASATATDAVPYRFHRRPVVLAAVLGPLAVALGLISNPQDAIRQRHAAERAVIEEQAKSLEELAAELEQQGETAAEATERLKELAEELAKSDSLEEAQRQLEQAADELAAAVPPDELAKKAATKGLEESLERSPLGDQGASAAEQLEATAGALGDKSAAELAELADRLDDLAETQEAGDPATAEALAEAAAAARAGDLATASARLGEAAAAHAAATAAASSAAASSAAAAAARAAADAAARAGDGDGTGKGSGSGSGKGSGKGSGSGSGSGSGGNPSGTVTGGGSGTDGRGGQGTPGGTNGTVAGQEPDTATIFDPVSGKDGETEAVGGSGAGDGSTIGITDGPTNAGGRTIPLSEALPQYTETATEALDRAAVPPSVRDLVLDYFDGLQGRNG